MTHAQPDTLSQIQALSNERQRLYASKWSKRSLSTFQEQIKTLDRQIAKLWHQHRCELAAEQRLFIPRRDRSGDFEMAAEDFFEDVREPAAESFQVRDGDRWRNVSADELAMALVRYIADIPLCDPDDIPIAPLKTVLAKRGLTLEWKRVPGGATYGKLVALPI